MAVRNLAAVLHGPMDLRMEDITIPVPGFNEVLLQMGSVGICGSDIKYWKDGQCGRFILNNPMVLGHEASGTVVQVGPGVKHLKQGDRVAIEPGVPCRMCRLCKSGKYNLCKDIEFCGTPPINGSICRLYKHAADFCFRLPDHVSLDEGALLEPLAVSVYSCQRGNVSLGSTVLICGAGPVGILTLMTAKQMGASSVIVTDIDTHRLEFARSKGADHIIKVNSNDPKEFATFVTEGVGFQPDVTIECSGTDFSFIVGLYATFPGGSVILIGRGQCNTPIPYNVAASKQVDIKGIFRYVNCYPTALEMVADGKIDVKSLVTHHFDMSKTVRAFETAIDRNMNSIKVIIDCN